MKKLFILLICLFLFGCNKNTIDVGVILTLSGPDSEIGIEARDGILLKIEEINASGGIKGKEIVAHIRDDEGKSELIKTYSQELYDQGMDAFIGFELSSKFVSIQDLLIKDVLVISPTISDYKVSNIKDNFFRTNSTNFDQGINLGIYANKTSSQTMILYDLSNEAYANGIIEGFLSEYEGAYDIYSLESDIYNQEEKILEIANLKSYDSVVLIFNPTDTSDITQVFYKNDLHYNLFSSNWGMVSNSFLAAGKAMEGMIFSTYVGDLDDPIYKSFAENFESRYNEAPHSISVYAYEATLMYCEALNQSPSLELKDVRETLLSLKDVQGIVTKLSFNEYGDIKRENHVTQIIDGELIRIGE